MRKLGLLVMMLMIGSGTATMAAVSRGALFGLILIGLMAAPVALADVEYKTISGDPLTIYVASDLSCQIGYIDQIANQLYPPSINFGDSGFFAWYDQTVYSPDFSAHGRTAAIQCTAWNQVTQIGPTGSGTAASPWIVTTVVDMGDVEIQIRQTVSYVNGEGAIQIIREITNNSASSRTATFFQGGDFYLQGSDNGYGYYNPSTGAVGGYNEAKDWYEIFYPITPATAYQEAHYKAIWRAIGTGPTSPGTGFNNTIEEDILDNGGGLQWTDVQISSGGFTTINMWWTFGTQPEPPIATHLILDSGDYNGDGSSDIAIYRGTSGLWAIRGVTRVYFGSASDIPVSGDYDGDGSSDIGIFRTSSGLWAIKGVTRAYFGGASDTAVPGDYNGDGRCDMGVYRGSSGLWAIKGITRSYFGGASDQPVPGYYRESSGKDIAIFRPSSGLWAVKGVTRVYFGGPSDEVAPGDYNGEGSWDIGIFRSTSGLWAIRGVSRTYFGSGSDLPVPGDYAGTGTDAIGIFRANSGLWAVRGITRAYYGSSGDIPVTR